MTTTGPRSAPTSHTSAFVTDKWAPVPEEDIPLSTISTSLDGQVRKTPLDEETVQRYMDDEERGEKLPPLKLRRLDDGTLLIGSGYHRREARLRRQQETVRAKIRPGTIEDAWDDGVEDNRKQGLQYKAEDRQHAAALYLRGERFAGGKISQEWIATKCGLSRATVSRLKATLSSEIVEPQTRTGQDGRTIHTGNIGRGRRPVEGGNAAQNKTLGGGESASTQPDLAVQRRSEGARPPAVDKPQPAPARSTARTWSCPLPGGGGELVFTEETGPQGQVRQRLTHKGEAPCLTRTDWKQVAMWLLKMCALGDEKVKQPAKAQVELEALHEAE